MVRWMTTSVVRRPRRGGGETEKRRPLERRRGEVREWLVCWEPDRVDITGPRILSSEAKCQPDRPAWTKPQERKEQEQRRR